MEQTPAQESNEPTEVETTEVEEPKPFDDASQEAVVSVFQKLFDEDPKNAVKTMRDNLAEAVEEKRITPEFQKILNEVLDDVEKADPDKQAQMFKEAVENSPELKDELANVLLLKDAAKNSVSSLLESGGPFAVLFAVLSLVAGGNGDFMTAMNGIAEELGIDMKPIQDALAPEEKPPEEPEAVAQNETPEPASEEESEAVVQNETPEPVSGEEPVTTQAEVAQVDTGELRGMDFSGNDSAFQGDETIGVNALAALSDVGVSTAGIEGLEQDMPADQLEETATYNPLALN